MPVTDPEVARPSTLRDLDPPSAIAIYTAATLLLLGGYTAVFAITLSAETSWAFRTAATNVLPLAALSAAFYRLLRDGVLKHSVIFQASAHVVLAPIFAGGWYLLTLLAQAALRALETGVFELVRFPGIALVWQLF